MWLNIGVDDMDKRLERILPKVQKPARYTGGEYNQIMKNKEEVDLRMAFCFPDTYEIGMSNIGLRILYGVTNNMPGVWCERVFAPWGDMRDEMKKAGIPLYALESGDPLSEFDVIGFSLGYEMAYTTVLDMLDMAGIPLHSDERTDLVPLVFAGGTACVNPAPMSKFMDLMVIGEGEEVNVEVLELFRKARNEGWSKQEFLIAASKIQGVYVPSLYEEVYNEDGTLAAINAYPINNHNLLFHDAVRPLLTERIIDDCLTALNQYNKDFPQKWRKTDMVNHRILSVRVAESAIISVLPSPKNLQIDKPVLKKFRFRILTEYWKLVKEYRFFS